MGKIIEKISGMINDNMFGIQDHEVLDEMSEKELQNQIDQSQGVWANVGQTALTEVEK